jgi:ATP-dependent Clp protease adaptor protein ClpS
MKTITKEEVSEKIEDILNKPYVLMLWNDSHNTFDWVIDCLIKVCNHEVESATQCAYLVHYTGKCDVKRGDKDTIKKMYDKLKSLGLTVTMESV